MKDNPLAKYHGSFTKITSKLKEYPIVGFDTEDDSKGTPTIFCFYGDYGNFTTRNYIEAIDYIYSLEKQTILVAHNLEYDIGNLFKHDDFLLVEEMVYASKLLQVKLFSSRNYFINSSCFFFGSLFSMGKFIGVPKLEGSALDERYCLRDAEIVYKFMKGFQSRLVNNMGVNLGITIGQMAMNIYRKDYMPSDTQITYNSPNTLKAYYGGRVEIFYKGAIQNPMVSDINSCYPHVMKNREYPDTSEIEPSTLATHKFGIGKFTVHVPENMEFPPLPWKDPDSKRLFFPVGTFTGWWTYAEIKYAMSLGVKVLNESEGEGTNRSIKPFFSFIDHFYTLRQEAKKRKELNPNDTEAVFDDLLYKLWQNNLYGKWGQHKSGSKMLRQPMSMREVEKYIKHEGFKTRKVGPFYSYDIPKIEPPKTANFLWGVYVTSYARIYLHEGILKVSKAGHIPVYCDTDSIIYIPKNSTEPLPISSELGDWDKETFDLGVFVQAKGYLMCKKKDFGYEIVKVACKGVPTKFAYDFILEGVATFRKPMRLKEALIRTGAKANAGKFLEDIGVNIWDKVTKEMRSIYIKRHGESGVTRPLHVSEIKEVVKNAMQTDIQKFPNEFGIVRPETKDNFENIEVPADWFNENPRIYRLPDKNSRVVFAKHTDLEGLKKGDIWFAGHVYSQGTARQSKKIYYKIALEVFLGKKAPVNFTLAVFSRFFLNLGFEEKIFGKYLVAELKNDYIGTGFPSLGFKIENSSLALGDDLEPEKDEESLTEAEITELNEGMNHEFFNQFSEKNLHI